MSIINKTTLQSNYQNIGDVYRDTNTEACFELIADAHNDTDAKVTLGLGIGGIKTIQLADYAVTNNKIAPGVITADKFVPTALTNDTQNGLRIVALQAETATVTNKLRTDLVSNNQLKTLVTFIDDDGGSLVWPTLKPIFESRNIPCTLAIISDVASNNTGVTPDQLRYLQNDLGWEIASHSKSHPQLNDISTENAEKEMSLSLSALSEMGLDVKHLVYPYGSPNSDVRTMVRKYYKSGVNSAGGGLNKLPIQQYSINRQAIGSYSGVNTLADYKILVDNAIANKTWLIFMTHIGETPESGIQDIKDTLDYIIANHVDIVNLDTGFEIFGNLIFQGDYNSSLENDKYHIVTKSGLEFKNQIKKTDVNMSTPFSSFPLGDTYKTFLNVDASGFPGGNGNGAGNLFTHRDTATDLGFGYQKFRPYNTTNIYFRFANVDGSWGTFARIDHDSTKDSKVIFGAQNQYLAANVPVDFPLAITINGVLNAQSSGFPNNLGGTLTTYKPSEDSSYGYQMYQNYATLNQYVRRYTGSAWTLWETLRSGISPNVNLYTNAQLASVYPIGAVTTFYINSGGATGFPTTAGTVSTYRPSAELGYTRQEFRAYNSNSIWSRFESATDGSWTAWVKISAV